MCKYCMHHLVVLSILISSVQCCFTSTETIRWADDGHLSRHTRPEIWRYLYERYITFLLLVWVSRGVALLVRQLFTSEEQKRLVRDVFDTSVTLTWRCYYDVIDTDCWSGTKWQHSRCYFATFKSRFLTGKMRNGMTNCFCFVFCFCTSVYLI